MKKFVRFLHYDNLISEGGEGVTDFEQLYHNYFNDVFLYIRRLSGDEHIAEEITSETFFKALQSIDSFRGECEVRVWLCQIAKNAYYLYLKKNAKTESLDHSEVQNLPDVVENVSEKVVWQDEVQRIQDVLHDLEDPYKEVFMWRVYAELSFKQIGIMFHKSENWACVTYHRARKKIKERLEEKK